MTRLFNRKDKTTIAELEEYYSSTGKKHRSGMAWLMAFLSIALTVIVIIALFFLGRWIYRTVTDSNDSTTTVSETEGGSVDLPTFDSDTAGQQGEQEESGSTASEAGGVVSDEAAVTTNDGQNSNAGSTGSADSGSSAAGTDTVPDTGAGEVIILIPIVAGATGYYLSRRYMLKQN